MQCSSYIYACGAELWAGNEYKQTSSTHHVKMVLNFHVLGKGNTQGWIKGQDSQAAARVPTHMGNKTSLE
jgi:hypothetical protein